MLHGWQHITEHEEHLIREGIRDGAVYGGPFHVELGPTDSCNYKCFFCNSAFIDRSQRIPWERMSRLLNELREMGMRSLRLAGGGEPLIYPEIDRILDFCIEHGIHITNITTNGFGLNQKIADRLLAADADELIVSFNDITPEKYAKTNGTTERAFEVVLNNIKYLTAERKRRGRPGPGVIQQFFVWKGNFAEIERAYELGLSCGADQIYLRDMSGLDAGDRMSNSELAQAGLAIERIKERDRENKLLLGFACEKIPVSAAPVQAAAPRPRTEYCYIGWYSTVIRGNGDVLPCCMLSSNPDAKPLANLNNFSTFREIWEGEAYRALRQELREIAIGRGDYQAVRHPCHTRPYCAVQYACPFIDNLARPKFYAAADRDLEPNRPNPGFLSRIVSRFK